MLSLRIANPDTAGRSAPTAPSTTLPGGPLVVKAVRWTPILRQRVPFAEKPETGIRGVAPRAVFVGSALLDR